MHLKQQRSGQQVEEGGEGRPPPRGQKVRVTSVVIQRSPHGEGSIPEVLRVSEGQTPLTVGLSHLGLLSGSETVDDWYVIEQ